MLLLYYWRGDNYRRDIDFGAGYHLNQSNPLLHDIDFGDSLWAFTRNSKGDYVLAAQLIIKAKTFNHPKFRYGSYQVWGDLNKSKYFITENQPSINQVVKHLSIKANAHILGRSFQGFSAVRKINKQDHKILSKISNNLIIDTRARILPEEKLEAKVLLGSYEEIEKLIIDESPGIAEKRAKYLIQKAPTRNKILIEKLQNLYNGKCQICKWDPFKSYSNKICHGHHVQWLSRGGKDEIDNMVLVCPNHHAAIHKCDTPFDYKEIAFIFPKHYEELMINKHLPT